MSPHTETNDANGSHNRVVRADEMPIESGNGVSHGRNSSSDHSRIWLRCTREPVDNEDTVYGTTPASEKSILLEPLKDLERDPSNDFEYFL